MDLSFPVRLARITSSRVRISRIRLGGDVLVAVVDWFFGALNLEAKLCYDVAQNDTCKLAVVCFPLTRDSAKRSVCFRSPTYRVASFKTLQYSRLRDQRR